MTGFDSPMRYVSSFPTGVKAAQCPVKALDLDRYQGGEPIEQRIVMPQLDSVSRGRLDDQVDRAKAMLVESQAIQAYCDTMVSRGTYSWRDAKERWYTLPFDVQKQWHGLKSARDINQDARDRCRRLIDNGFKEAQEVLDILTQLAR